MLCIKIIINIHIYCFITAEEDNGLCRKMLPYSNSYVTIYKIHSYLYDML